DVSDTDAVTVPALRVPRLATTASATAVGGSTITYTIAVTNPGNVTLTGIVVVDANATVDTCTPALPAGLAPAATLTCAATHTITQADRDRGEVTNVATASGRDPTGSPVTDRSAPAVTALTRTPALTTTKNQTATDGSTITYAIGVTNTGN